MNGTFWFGVGFESLKYLDIQTVLHLLWQYFLNIGKVLKKYRHHRKWYFVCLTLKIDIELSDIQVARQKHINVDRIKVSR